MVQIKLKRVYEAEETTDGFRVLVNKLWPRGMKKENLHYNLWAKDIAPSILLRKWYHQDSNVRWEEFKERYTEELKASTVADGFLALIKGKQVVTLLYASNNKAENHAKILQEYLEKTLAGKN